MKQIKNKNCHIELKMIVLLILLVCAGSQMMREKDSLQQEERQIQQSNLLGSCSDIIGCEACGEDGHCSKCRIDTFLVDGKCKCIFDKSFNVDGDCVYCSAMGCKACQSGNYFASYTCAVCQDPAAEPINGECLCPTGQALVEGTCQSCPVPLTNGQCVLCEQLGCEECEGSVCTKCKDNFAMVVEGQCVCLGGTLNANGFCNYCLAEGCKICESDAFYSQRCYQCQDPNARPNDGICMCLDGSDISQSRPCCQHPLFKFYQHCAACLPACSQCSRDNPNICSSCHDGYYLDSQFCYQCPEGCLSCTSASVCTSYPSTHYPSGQECVPNCNFPCSTCSATDPNGCASCVEGYEPMDITCTLSTSCTDSNCVFCPDLGDACERCASGFEEFRGKCRQEGNFCLGATRN